MQRKCPRAAQASAQPSHLGRWLVPHIRRRSHSRFLPFLYGLVCAPRQVLSHPSMFNRLDGGGAARRAHGEETRVRVLLRAPLVEADVRDCREPPASPPRRLIDDPSQLPFRCERQIRSLNYLLFICLHAKLPPPPPLPPGVERQANQTIWGQAKEVAFVASSGSESSLRCC